MKNYIMIFLLITVGVSIEAQITNTATMDTSSFSHKGKVSIEGYIDTYYAYNFNAPASDDQPYFVSMARHNEVNVNLAYIDLKYSSSRLRARFVPGFGTYMNANYAAEPGLSATGCVYAVSQEQSGKSDSVWWQANLIGRYNITDELSVTGRIEHFNDPDEVQIVPITGVKGFRSYSSSLGLNYELAENILLRAEGRTFFSDKYVYVRGEEQVKNSNAITSNITNWF